MTPAAAEPSSCTKPRKSGDAEKKANDGRMRAKAVIAKPFAVNGVSPGKRTMIPAIANKNQQKSPRGPRRRRGSVRLSQSDQIPEAKTAEEKTQRLRRPSLHLPIIRPCISLLQNSQKTKATAANTMQKALQAFQARGLSGGYRFPPPPVPLPSILGVFCRPRPPLEDFYCSGRRLCRKESAALKLRKF